MNNESGKFGLAEAFEVAGRLEKDGASFYKEAADFVRSEDAKALLLELAEMEESHESIFDAMKSDLDQSRLDDSNGISGSMDYLKVLAANYSFIFNQKAADVLSVESTVLDVLRAALQTELASIAYYQGLLSSLPPEIDNSFLQEVIMEEQEHVVLINKKIIYYLSNYREVGF